MISTNTFPQIEPHKLFLNEDIFDKVGALALGAISTGIISVNGPKLMITGACCYILLSAITLQQQAQTIKAFTQGASTTQNTTAKVSVACQNSSKKETQDSATQTTNQDETTIKIQQDLIEAQRNLIRSFQQSERSRNQQAKKSSSPPPISPQRDDDAPQTLPRILEGSVSQSLQRSETTTASPPNNMDRTTTSEIRPLHQGKKTTPKNAAANLTRSGIPYQSTPNWR